MSTLSITNSSPALDLSSTSFSSTLVPRGLGELRTNYLRAAEALLDTVAPESVRISKDSFEKISQDSVQLTAGQLRLGARVLHEWAKFVPQLRPDEKATIVEWFTNLLKAGRYLRIHELPPYTGVLERLDEILKERTNKVQTSGKQP